MKKKLQTLLQNLSQGLIEREVPLRLVLLAALAGEHLLLLGPPGTAKSELARRVRHAFSDGQYFERLLTRFSVPEELFGPLSIKALEQDRYERLTARYLPTATIAFIDEIFKANSAILNSLLTLLNEREFDNGDQRIKTPLITVVAASNELPSGEELNALYDRFLLRCQVTAVSEQGFAELLEINEAAFQINTENQLQAADLAVMQQQAAQIDLSPEVIRLLKDLRVFLQHKNIYVSDRRWRKIIKLLKVAVYTNGKKIVSVWDCWLLQHCLWEAPAQHSMIFDWYQQQLGTQQQVNLQQLNKVVEVWQQTLQEEQDKTIPLSNEQGENLYYDPQGHVTTTSGRSYLAEQNGEFLYIAPADGKNRKNEGKGYTQSELAQHFFDDYHRQRHIDGQWVSLNDYIADAANRLRINQQYQACLQSVQYSAEHIKHRGEELNGLLTDIDDYRDQVITMLASLAECVDQHLWISQGFSETARQILTKNLDRVTKLSEQVKKIQVGFQQLPVAA